MSRRPIAIEAPPEPIWTEDAFALDPREVMFRLNIDRNTFWQAVRDGHLKVVRLGRTVRVPLADFKRLMREGTPVEQISPFANARVTAAGGDADAL
ncbi:MAG: helix-turn-helix domain-containing protein [Methylobacteriaceae bacterium]|nr:helix-turn-helix domain-containing protein [Methylobacteriaceae bacterium]